MHTTRQTHSHLHRLRAATAFMLALCVQHAAQASDLDTLGITQLRAIRPDLVGTGVSVAQVEATTYNNPNDPNNTMPYDPQYDSDNFETNPSVNPSTPITYVNKLGTATTTFTTSQESGHADLVGDNLFGTSTGTAPGISALVSYNVNYFFDTVIQTPTAIQIPLAPVNAPPVRIVTQSFIFTDLSASDTTAINQLYDDYVASTNTLIITAAGNGGGIQVPATAYNVIAVGDSSGATSVGPTSDGRSKPDIAAPGGETSFSTPYVSGIAAVLIQAGSTGAGGTSPATETAATNPLTIKALLMNGATKYAGWTNSPTAPLDPTTGAGVANAYNSYENLVAGQHSPQLTNTSLTPATGSTTTSAGWDLNSLTTPDSSNAVAHYLLNVPGTSAFTSTLTWDRPAGTITANSIEATTLNTFELLLYNVVTNTITEESISTVDNVQYLYMADLPAGIYDLEVVKIGLNAATATDTYALAFNAQLLNPVAGLTYGSDAETDLPTLGSTPSISTPEPASLLILGFAAVLPCRRRLHG
jgi:hypothetical protein